MNIQDFLQERGYQTDFSLAVTDELKNVPDMIPEGEINRRRQLFDKTIITIDGDDAKDLDDAVSLEQTADGKYLLGVHIADVSHYVRENTALDDEAYARGTSVYLVDTVVPMLPTKLSNELCSLQPHKPRLTLSCFMTINRQGKIVNYEICETVIKSCARMTYKKVTQILEGNMAARHAYKALVPMFEQMRELALLLRDKRMRRGSIDFDFPEPYIKTDENGKAIDVQVYPITISNKMIEEFMLAANETVARHCANLNIPSVYRVHEHPDEEKLEKLAALVRTFGHRLKAKGNVTPKTLQSLLFRADGTNAQTVLSTMLLRAMMKARYSEENLGHFGLAADFYCHFTSPIRRYPDLMVHRILKEWLHGTLSSARIRHYRKTVRLAAKQSSETEADATVAERDYDDYKICEYMEQKVGQEFTGTICSVTSFGFFVQLPDTVEGLVRMVDLKDDYYVFDESACVLAGKRSGRLYCMGQEVRVRLAKVNTELKQIDFVLAEDEKPAKKKKEGKQHGGSKGKKRRKKNYCKK